VSPDAPHAPALDPSWQGEARALLDRAAERHGGWARWQRLSAVRGRLVTLSGPLLWLKGLGRTWHMPTAAVTVRPHEQRAHWPLGEDAWTFDRGQVAGPGAPPDADARASITRRATFSPWRQADGVYFFGYALSNYWGLPFLLGQARVLSVTRRGRLRSVTLAMPSGLHTHGPVQSFYFDETGLLRRHDYVAEVLGPKARGAHFSSDYVDVSGLLLARRRLVVFERLGRAWPLPILWARFDGLSVEDGG
jgi:hypothetical protein